jgi:hypothetical protein
LRSNGLALKTSKSADCSSSALLTNIILLMSLQYAFLKRPF